MKKIFLFITLFLLSSLMFSQDDTKKIYEGNEAFAKKNYVVSESNYRFSAAISSDKKAIANYNLGNSIYKLNQPREAMYKFYEATKTAKTKEEKHKSFHNLGNALMVEKDYKNAVESYKMALRNNPYDEETRYNFALAKKLNKENPPKPPKNKGGGKNKSQENQNPEKNKDNTNQNQKEENPKPSGSEKQKIDQILDAVNNEERRVQEKINNQKTRGNSSQNEKDW